MPERTLAVGAFFEHTGSEHVGRHQVRRELDAAERKTKPACKALNEGGLAETRRGFEQDVSPRKQPGEQQVHDILLADESLCNRSAQAIKRRAQAFKSRGVDLEGCGIAVGHGGPRVYDSDLARFPLGPIFRDETQDLIERMDRLETIELKLVGVTHYQRELARGGY